MDHILLKDLKIYQKALIIGNKSWEIYKNFTWQVKKTIGDQFIMAIDTIYIIQLLFKGMFVNLKLKYFFLHLK